MGNSDDVKCLKDIVEPQKTYLEDVINHRSPIIPIPYVNFFREREGLSLVNYGEVSNTYTMWIWFYPLCVEYYKEKYET